MKECVTGQGLVFLGSRVAQRNVYVHGDSIADETDVGADRVDAASHKWFFPDVGVREDLFDESREGVADVIVAMYRVPLAVGAVKEVPGINWRYPATTNAAGSGLAGGRVVEVLAKEPKA